jgi:hypothetical protein
MQGLTWIPKERTKLRAMLCRWVPAFPKILVRVDMMHAESSLRRVSRSQSPFHGSCTLLRAVPCAGLGPTSTIAAWQHLCSPASATPLLGKLGAKDAQCTGAKHAQCRVNLPFTCVHACLLQMCHLRKDEDVKKELTVSSAGTLVAS